MSTTSKIVSSKSGQREQVGDLKVQRVSGHLPMRDIAVTIVGVVILLFFAASADHFTDPTNLFNLLRTAAFTVIIGIPLTYLMIVGEFDLSVGPNFALSSVVMVLAVQAGLSPWVAALCGIGAAVSIGLLNAAVTVGFGVPSFISTLGTMSIAGGIAISLTGGLPASLPDNVTSSAYASITGGMVGPVPVHVFWAAVVLFIGGFILRYTPFGAHIYAAGGNPKAASRQGVKVHRARAYCFILVGVGAGLAGVLMTGWLGSASPSVGAGNTLVLYSAIIIGGAAVTGGEGSAWGTLVGALIIAMLRNGLILLGVQSSWVDVFQGVLIVVAGVSVLMSRPDTALSMQVSRVLRALQRHGSRLPSPEVQSDTADDGGKED